MYTRSALCIIIFFNATVDTLSPYPRSIPYTLVDYLSLCTIVRDSHLITGNLNGSAKELLFRIHRIVGFISGESLVPFATWHGFAVLRPSLQIQVALVRTESL